MNRPLIAAVLALETEARALLGPGTWERRDGFALRRFVLGPAKVLCALSGPGPGRARAAARYLAGQGASLLLSPGLSGGLDPGLSAGSLVLAGSCLDPDRPGPAGLVWEAALAEAELMRGLARDLEQGGFVVRVGPVCSSDRLVSDPAVKQGLGEACGALAVDMESAAVADAARESGRGFLALRAVVDCSRTPVPEACLRAVGRDGRLRPWTLAWPVLRRPGLVRDLLRLRRGRAAALASLAAAWRGLGARLEQGFPF
ncbi:MAG: hypothetical protein JW718_09415 [Desulfovibrionaceae bacterium]|nr:hypothetical protein [Desulfovibrionaceae bacterium]